MQFTTAVPANQEPCKFDPETYEKDRNELEEKIGECLSLDEADDYVQQLIEKSQPEFQEELEKRAKVITDRLEAEIANVNKNIREEMKNHFDELTTSTTDKFEE